jgi:HAE1 family hydrophobic/amphiphilic exporter-1
MDLQVTQVIENVVSSVSGITDINSSSSQGMSRVFLAFDPSTDKYADANQIATAVSAAVRSLPANVTVPTIQTFDPNSDPIIQFGIEGHGADLAEVNDYVQNILGPSLERIDGVATMLTDGGPSKQFEVLLNPDRLRYYNISPQEVVAAITGSALQMPIGTIVKNNNALTFSTQNQPADISQISRTLVDSNRGVRVDQLGSVWDIPAATDYARVNGMPVVLVSVQKTTDANSVAVADTVRAALKSMSLPTGYSIEISNDSTGPIRASVNSTYRELLITALVVALIVLLFLGKLNTAISVILAIPIALSAAPVLYKLAGFSLNLVSLLALIIAIGIVVDDSIVVSENVERYRAMGFSLRDSVLRGASEVFSAVVAASLSLLSVLLPVSFIGGFIGSFLQQFSLGLAAAVAFSLLEAVLFLTVRLAYTPESKDLDWADFLRSWVQLPDAIRWGFRSWRTAFGIVVGIAGAAAILFFTRKPVYLLAIPAYPVALGIGYYLLKIALSLLQSLTSLLHGWTEAGLVWIRDAYARSLSEILHRGVLVLVGCALFLGAIAFFIVPRVPFNFVPNTDSGSLEIHLRNPPGAPLAVTNTGVGKIERFLRAQPEVTTIQSVIGTSAGGVSGTFTGTNTANMTVQLIPVTRRANVFQLVPRYRSAILALFQDQPSTQVMIHGGGGFGPSGTSLSLSIVSPDFTTLVERNGRFIQEIQKNPWVVDVYSSLSDTSLENDFIPDPSRLQGTGISPSMIANALQTYASGVQASTVVTGGLSYPIQVQADPTALSGVQSLLNLPIYSPALKTMVHLGQLGTFKLNQAPVSMSRYNRTYTGNLTITMSPDAPPILVVKDRITGDLEKSGLLEGGLAITSNSRFNPVTLAAQLLVTGPLTFLLALFLAYLVMAAQFNSWRYPVYLLLPVPLALVGALLLVFAQGGGLDIFGMMGMLMLIGLSAKNAILYLDFVVERIGKMPFKDALVEAARLRFRPIIMATMTVLVISFPLILGRGEGSEFGKNMGVVMLGGIVFSAILTFFVVPAAFYLFERKRVDRTSPVVVPLEKMQLGKNLEALEVPMRLGANASTIYPVLMWDKKDGATLIDTGVPGSDQAIGEHLARLGLGWKDVRRIIITHQDIDHIGGASAAVMASNAEVLAHGDDIPYIQGDRRLLKMDPNRIETMLQTVPAEQRERVRQLFANPPKVHVNRALVDGEKLPYGGGIVVIHTPGHTPGHISLFLTADRLLISGDALRAENGVLQGPSPTATPNLPQATASLRKLLDYPIDRVLCYHGGLTNPGALARLRELVGSA